MEKKNPPYSIAALVLGICSIVFSCAFVGLVCGIIGLVLSGNGFKAYRLNPDDYSGTGMLQAGKITSIIGIVLGSLYVVYVIVLVCIIGAGFSLLPFLDACC